MADNTRLISNVNFNQISGAKDIVNIFIVYKINSYAAQVNWCNGLFGHDNGGYDKLVAFGTGSGNLGISGANPDFVC